MISAQTRFADVVRENRFPLFRIMPQVDSCRACLCVTGLTTAHPGADARDVLPRHCRRTD